MLELLEPKREMSAWAASRQAIARKAKLVFEPVPNQLSTSSGSLSMYRAKIPGGWLVVSRPSDAVTFVPDPSYDWE